VRKTAFAALAGLKYEHDTVADGAVQVRLYIGDPASVKNDLMVSGYVKGSDVDYARNNRVNNKQKQSGAVQIDYSTFCRIQLLLLTGSA